MIGNYWLHSQQKWKTLAHKKFVYLAMLSLFVMLVAVFMYLVVVPTVSTIIITKLLELRNGTHVLRLWLNPPVPMLTRIYLWNLTNPEDVATGRMQPLFSQAGPYVYEQYTEKIPIKFEDDSIVYHSRANFKFREDLTLPATLDDTVITLNAGLYGAADLVDNLAPMMMSLVNRALPYLFPGEDSIFMTVRVGSFLFDGLVLNCSNAEGTVAEMVCNALPLYAPPTIQRKDDSSDFIYSFLAHKNYTLQGPYQECRGLKDIKQVGTLMSLNNQSQLGVWQKDSQCDTIQGNDVFTFPPFIGKDDHLKIFIPDICQVVPIRFEQEDRLQEVSVYKFMIEENWLGNVRKNPENACFCLKKQFCSNDGVRDISPCMKAPVVISLPHFYLADEDIQNYALGMTPSQELHASMVYMEPQTGTPIKAAKRLQFNMNLRRIKGFHLVENVTEGLFPLVWVEEVAELSGDLLGTMSLPLTIQWAVNALCLVLTVLTLIATICSLITFLYLNRLWCFSSLSNNQVAALFSQRSSESNHTGDRAGVHTLAYSLYPDRVKHENGPSQDNDNSFEN